MNILLLAPELLPIRGGVSTYIVELIKNIPDDVQIYVLTPKRSGLNKIMPSDEVFSKSDSFSERTHVNYIGTTKDTFFSNFIFQMNCLKTIPSMIKQFDIDLIHSQSEMPDLFLLPRMVRAPIVTTIHTTIRDEINSTKASGTYFSDFSSSEKTMVLLSPFLKMLEKLYYSNNRHYITVSNWMKNHFQKDYHRINPDNIKVIYNGVNSTVFNPMNKRLFNRYFPELVDINVPKVLYLSRWNERKGIRYFLDAIPKINKKFDVHFILAGLNTNGRYKIPLENCTLLGYVPQEKTPCLYASCDIFMLPSLYENFPICLLEAMSSELTVISTNVGGIQEMISHEKNGIIIRPKSVHDIVESIENLVENDQLRKKLGVNARKTVQQKFSWKKIALEIKEYYTSVIEKHVGNRT